MLWFLNVDKVNLVDDKTKDYNRTILKAGTNDISGQSAEKIPTDVPYVNPVV